MPGHSSARRRARHQGPSQRQLKVGEQLRHVVAQALSRGDVHDPRVLNANLTVTEVQVSPDLRHAKLFVTELGHDRLSEQVQAGLERAGAFLAGQVARELKLKFAPKLHFEPDLTFLEVAKVERLLDEGLGVERRAGSDHSAGSVDAD